MPRGLPDDSNIVKQGGVYNLSDMAELAARLGSPLNYIRFGDVVFLTSFEHGYDMLYCSPAGGGAYGCLTSDFTRTKGTAVHLYTGTAADCGCPMRVILPCPITKHVGFGCAFKLGPGVVKIVLSSSLTRDDVLYSFRITFDLVTKLIYYDPTVGLPVSFAPHRLKANTWPFHVAKLVVDIDKPEYVRFYFDHESWKLSPASGPVGPAVGLPSQIEYNISPCSALAAGCHLYVDDMVITQNDL